MHSIGRTRPRGIMHYLRERFKSKSILRQSLLNIKYSPATMPIIDLAFLKIHLANLVMNCGDPKLFIHDFHNLVDDYYNHTRRESQKYLTANSRSDNITSTIINQVVNEVSPLILSDPTMGALLIISLWEDGSLETRILSSLPSWVYWILIILWIYYGTCQIGWHRLLIN